MDRLLHEAVRMNRLDLIELLHRNGANPKTMCYDCVASSRDPLILRWFEDHGIDLVTDYPVAAALQAQMRNALGTYMRWKDRLPQLKHQANIALRYHTTERNLKWVCLLLWAGADPRASVPRLDTKPQYEDDSTALEEAVSDGSLDILAKFKLDPAKDNLDLLLAISATNPALVEKLLKLGANPHGGGELSGVEMYMWRLSSALKRDSSFDSDYRRITDILGMMAAKGGKWRPQDNDGYRDFRKTLLKANPSHAVTVVEKLLAFGFLTDESFKELMVTPSMRELLSINRPGVIRLRDLAGFADPHRPRGRGRQKSK